MPVLGLSTTPSPSFKAVGGKSGVWSPGSSPAATPQTKPKNLHLTIQIPTESSSGITSSPVWKPTSPGKPLQDSSKVEFKSVKLDTSTVKVENGINPASFGSSTSKSDEIVDPSQGHNHPPPIPPKPLLTDDSFSPDAAPPTFTPVNRAESDLLPFQNPAVKLIQEALEARQTQNSDYTDDKMYSKENYHRSYSGQQQRNGGNEHAKHRWLNDRFVVTSEEYLDDRKVTHLEPVKYEGIGPTVQGVPISLCTGVKDENKAEWYKRMYKSLHRALPPDEYEVVNYLKRGRPYLGRGGGYMSEPEPERNEDYGVRRYGALDRRKNRNDYYVYEFGNGGQPKKKPNVWNPPSARYSSDIYKNQPKRIEDYEPGHSSIAEMEAKMGGSGARQDDVPLFKSTLKERQFLLKDGYESDSSLVYHKRGGGGSIVLPPDTLSPAEQRAWYREVQKGGDIPLTGFRKPPPDKSEEDHSPWFNRMTVPIRSGNVHWWPPRYFHRLPLSPSDSLPNISTCEINSLTPPSSPSTSTLDIEIKPAPVWRSAQNFSQLDHNQTKLQNSPKSVKSSAADHRNCQNRWWSPTPFSASLPRIDDNDDWVPLSTAPSTTNSDLSSLSDPCKSLQIPDLVVSPATPTSDCVSDVTCESDEQFEAMNPPPNSSEDDDDRETVQLFTMASTAASLSCLSVLDQVLKTMKMTQLGNEILLEHPHRVFQPFSEMIVTPAFHGRKVVEICDVTDDDGEVYLLPFQQSPSKTENSFESIREVSETEDESEDNVIQPPEQFSQDEDNESTDEHGIENASVIEKIAIYEALEGQSGENASRFSLEKSFTCNIYEKNIEEENFEDENGHFNEDENNIRNFIEDENNVGNLNEGENNIEHFNEDENNIGNLNEDENNIENLNEDENEITQFNGDENEITHLNGDETEITHFNEDENNIDHFNESEKEIRHSNMDVKETTHFNEDENKIRHSNVGENKIRHSNVDENEIWYSNQDKTETEQSNQNENEIEDKMVQLNANEDKIRQSNLIKTEIERSYVSKTKCKQTKIGENIIYHNPPILTEHKRNLKPRVQFLELNLVNNYKNSDDNDSPRSPTNKERLGAAAIEAINRHNSYRCMSPERQQIRHMLSGSLDTLTRYNPPSNHLDKAAYMEYLLSFARAPHLTERFSRLRSYYGTLERIATVESVARRSRSLSLQSVSVPELQRLYGELDRAQRAKEFLYKAESILERDRARWTRDSDRYLNYRCQSVNDLRQVWIHHQECEMARLKRITKLKGTKPSMKLKTSWEHIPSPTKEAVDVFAWKDPNRLCRSISVTNLIGKFNETDEIVRRTKPAKSEKLNLWSKPWSKYCAVEARWQKAMTENGKNERKTPPNAKPRSVGVTQQFHAREMVSGDATWPPKKSYSVHDIDSGCTYGLVRFETQPPVSKPRRSEKGSKTDHDIPTSSSEEIRVHQTNLTPSPLLIRSKSSSTSETSLHEPDNVSNYGRHHRNLIASGNGKKQDIFISRYFSPGYVPLRTQSSWELSNGVMLTPPFNYKPELPSDDVKQSYRSITNLSQSSMKLNEEKRRSKLGTHTEEDHIIGAKNNDNDDIFQKGGVKKLVSKFDSETNIFPVKPCTSSNGWSYITGSNLNSPNPQHPENSGNVETDAEIGYQPVGKSLQRVIRSFEADKIVRWLFDDHEKIDSSNPLYCPSDFVTGGNSGKVSRLKHRYEHVPRLEQRYRHQHEQQQHVPSKNWQYANGGRDDRSWINQQSVADNQFWVVPGPSKSSPNLLVDFESTDRPVLDYSNSTPDCLDTLSDSSYSPYFGWMSGFAVHDRSQNRGSRVRMPDIKLFSPRKYDRSPTNFRRMCRSEEDIKQPKPAPTSTPSHTSTWPFHSKVVTGAVKAGISRFGDNLETNRSYTYSPLITSTPTLSPKHTSPELISYYQGNRRQWEPPKPSWSPSPPPPRRQTWSRQMLSQRDSHPVYRNIEKPYASDEENRKRQEWMKQQMCEEERRKKTFLEMVDIESRRHTDNFVPNMKSPIPLDRYDQIYEESNTLPVQVRTTESSVAGRALHSFRGLSTKELSFNKDDIILIHRKIDKNWYEGEHHGLIGIFPANHVEIIPYESVKVVTKKPFEGQGRVKYNFQAQTNLELSLVKGETVVLTRKIDRNWYEGRIGSAKGMFPASYIDVLSEPDNQDQIVKPVASPVSHSLIKNGTYHPLKSSPENIIYNSANYYNNQRLSSTYTETGRRYGGTNKSAADRLFGERKMPLDQTLHVHTQSDPMRYRAIFHYKPQNDDELELEIGDTVFVMEKCDDGWFVGSSQRTGLFGTFPGNYVEKICK